MRMRAAAKIVNLDFIIAGQGLVVARPNIVRIGQKKAPAPVRRQVPDSAQTPISNCTNPLRSGLTFPSHYIHCTARCRHYHLPCKVEGDSRKFDFDRLISYATDRETSYF